MMDLEFSFDRAPWEGALENLTPGSRISALQLLTLLERESEDALQEALLELELRRIELDISDLPAGHGSGEAAVRLRREAELVRNGYLMQALEENDPLKLYLLEVENLPMSGDVQRMAERFAGGHDPVLPGLTNRMLPTVIEMAKQMTGYGVLLLDLIQEGSLGLWQGILNYTGGDFVSHARWFIGQYLARAVLLQARAAGVGQRMKEAMEDFRSVDEHLLSELGRNPTMQELADAMHMTLDEITVVAATVENARMLQRAHDQGEEKEERPEEEQTHVEDTALFQSRQRIQELLEDLTEQEVQLIQLRFGLEGGKPLSPEQTGLRMGLTPEEAVAMEAAALAKMRKN